MKKLMLPFVGVALFLGLAFIGKDAAPGVGLSPGSRFPKIQMNDPVTGSFDLKELKGKYVLVNFWASYDVASRLANIQLNTAVEQMDREDVACVSFSFDRNISVFEEIVRMDDLQSTNQYFVQGGVQSQIYRDMDLKQGFKNYLLNQEGVIIGKNVSPERLTDWIN